MSRAVLLCVVLFVGSASAWGNWWSRNRQTECGKFRTLRDGWFFQKAKTDIDTRAVLADLKYLDADKDGFLTFAEVNNPVALQQFDSSLNFNNGIPRCKYVTLLKKRYGFEKEVANAVFDLADRNKDLILNLQDSSPAVFAESDKNGDGQLSICEVFRGYMSVFQLAEQQTYLRELKYSNLVWKFRKPSFWHFWRW